MKPKKIFSAILLLLYLIFLYWLLSQMTDHPLAVIMTMLLSMLFMTVTHELGHLIGGLLTGYRFVSFRIFSFTLLKANGGWSIRQMSVPGPAGQCLMAPPRKKNGHYPFVLYHLGGILFCGCLSLFVIFTSVFIQRDTLQMLVFMFGFVSFFMNLFNAVPTNGKSMINDATNLKMAMKSDTARLALWNQLEYVSLHARNVRTADMPEELFALPDKKELSNPLIIWQVIAAVEHAEDREEYEKARDIVSFALDNAPFLFPLYRSALQLEAVYLDSVLKTESDDADVYYSQIQKTPALRNLISFHRASFAYLLLRKKDTVGAEKALSDYQKKIKKAPFEADVIFEEKQLTHIHQIND